jgi:hypothetical protein
VNDGPANDGPVNDGPANDGPANDGPADERHAGDRLCNLRDVGGIPLAGGGVVASGVLYRGDAPMAGDRPPTLTPWPPATVIDLRSPSEREQMMAADPWPDGVRVVESSLLAALNPWSLIRRDDPLTAPEMLTGLFAHVLRDSRREVVEVVGTIATAPAPVFVHCSGGKDRTALIVALVLEVVGADHDALMADHLASNDAVPVLERRLERALGRELEAPLSRVDEGSMRSALETWRAHPGGAEGWLLDSGLPVEHLEALLERLVSGP